MSHSIVFLAGSPQPTSRSTRIAAALADRLTRADVAVRSFGLTDFDASDLVFARTDAPAVKRYLEQVQSASALVFSTPVYKATYSGGLKLLLDLIPPDALRGKAVLAIASARIGHHFQSVQRGFDDLYRFFDAGLVVPSVFVLDEQVKPNEDTSRWDPAVLTALDRAATALLAAPNGPASANAPA